MCFPSSCPNSLTLIGSSPAAFPAMRRKLATDTPGIAAGYWKARKRPARARSSGSASVRSSPRKTISPSVISYAGWPRMVLASVDLPEPLGPIRAWISPLLTDRSTPRRISRSSVRTWRFLISRSAMFSCSRGRARSGGHGLARLVLYEVGKRRVLERAHDRPAHPGPQQLGGADPVVVGGFPSADDGPVGALGDALDGGDRALQGGDHLGHRDLLGR